MRELANACTVHRQGEKRHQECDWCACARFRDEWRVATTHPASMRTLLSLSTHYTQCLMFSVCVIVTEPSCRSHEQHSYSQHPRNEPDTPNPPRGSSWLACIHFQHVLVGAIVVRKNFASLDKKPERIPSGEMWLQKVGVTMEEEYVQSPRTAILLLLLSPATSRCRGPRSIYWTLFHPLPTCPFLS